MIDELFPVVTTAALAELLDRDVDQRPVEDLFWEFKAYQSAENFPATVCAFVNTLGGIQLLGA